MTDTINFTHPPHLQEIRILKFMKLRNGRDTVSNLLEITDTTPHVCPIRRHATGVECPCFRDLIIMPVDYDQDSDQSCFFTKFFSQKEASRAIVLNNWFL